MADKKKSRPRLGAFESLGKLMRGELPITADQMRKPKKKRKSRKQILEEI